MHRICLFFLIPLFHLSSFSQESSSIDSLEKLLKKSQDDKTKIDLYSKLSQEYFNSSPQKALETAHFALQLASKNQNKELISQTNYDIGIIQHKIADYDSAKIYLFRASKFCFTNDFRTKIYDDIGILYRDLSLFDSSLHFHNQSLRLKQTLGDRQGVAVTFNNIGNVYLRMRKFDEALSNYREALDIYKEVDDKDAIASILNNIGDTYKKMSLYDKAIQALEEALEMQKEIGNKKHIAYTLQNIGNFYFQLKIYDKAQEFYAKALEIRIALGDNNDIAASRFNMATVHRDLGNYKEALKYYTMSLELRKKTGDKEAEALTLTAIGGLYKNQKMYSQAIYNYELAIKMQEEIGSLLNIASTYEKLGVAYKDTSLYSQAIEEYSKSKKLYIKLDNKIGVARINNYIGNVYREQLKYAKAIELYEEALHMYSSIQNQQGTAYTCNNLGELYSKQGNMKEAISFYLLAQAYADSCNEKTLLEKNSYAIYEIYKHEKKYKEALSYFELYNATKDTLAHDKNIRRIAELEFETNIKLLEKINENQELKLREEQSKRLQVRLYLIIAIIIALIILGFSILLYKQFSQKKKAFDMLTQNRKELEKAYNELENVHEILRNRNEKITDSINYAKRIQTAILPDNDLISKVFSKHFIYYLPKENVSGDFYWFSEQGDNIFLAAIDCTGHGIPGAFMSMVGNALLNQIINESHISEPAEILTKLDQEVIKTLKQYDENNKQEDGMELSLLRYNKKNNTLTYATAGHKIIVIRNQDLEIYSTCQFSIGGMHSIKIDHNIVFTQENIEITPGMKVYLYSDGYIDQFGSEKDERIGSTRFQNLLLETSTIDLNEQYTLLSKYFDDWKEDKLQIDDVIVIGIEF